jgi:hypothetical protein
MKLLLPCFFCLCAGFAAGLYLTPATRHYGDILPIETGNFARTVPEPAAAPDAPGPAEGPVAIVESMPQPATQPVPAASPEEVIHRAHDHALVAVDQMLGGAIRTESMDRTRDSVARLAESLGLSAAQERRLFYAAEQLMAANPLPVPVAADAFDSPLRAEIEALLRPDQQAAYDTLLQRSRLNWVESRAYSELARRQGAASYTQDEKDALFEELVDEFAAAAAE